MQTQSELIGELVIAQQQKNTLEEAKLIRKIINKNHTENREKNIGERFFGKLSFGISDCWFWDGCIDEIGYGRLGKYDGENKAHRISWKLFKGEIPKGMKVLHSCDIRCCVNPDHLFLGTQKDNVRDMMSKKRDRFCKPRKGELNSLSKLTDKKVLAMRCMYELEDISFKSLAERFGISTMTAYRAVTKQAWSHL